MISNLYKLLCVRLFVPFFVKINSWIRYKTICDTLVWYVKYTQKQKSIKQAHNIEYQNSMSQNTGDTSTLKYHTKERAAYVCMCVCGRNGSCEGAQKFQVTT